LARLVYCADLLTRRAANVGDWRSVLRPVGLMFCFFGGLVMLQPDMGTTIILAILTGAILFVGGVRMRHMATVLGAGFGAGAFLAIVEPYRRERLLSFLDPFSHYKEGGYQVPPSLLALGSRGGDGRPSRHRRAAPVRRVRRVGPAVHDVRHRRAAQRRPAGPVSQTFALITGGGTGGHVYPGLALAEALVARGHPRESIHWVGSAGKLEETAVPAAGFSIDVLPGRGLQRRLTAENVSVLVKTTTAFG